MGERLEEIDRYEVVAIRENNDEVWAVDVDLREEDGSRRITFKTCFETAETLRLGQVFVLSAVVKEG